MKKVPACLLIRLFTVPVFLSLFFMGCATERREPQRDEVIAGVVMPIPRGMSKTKEQRIQLSLPGYGGGQETYRGRVDVSEIIAFYQKEMPARGWKANATLVTQGGMLAYTKDNRAVLIRVGTSGGDTTLAILVGTQGP